MPALCTHQKQQVCAEQTLCRAGEAAFQKLFSSCLTWQVMKNEELSRELLNLANANCSPAVAGESFAELGRVRAMMHHLSAQKVKVRTDFSALPSAPWRTRV